MLNFTEQSFHACSRVKLGQKIISNAQNRGNATNNIPHYQKQSVLNKRFLLHFR